MLNENKNIDKNNDENKGENNESDPNVSKMIFIFINFF